MNAGVTNKLEVRGKAQLTGSGSLMIFSNWLSRKIIHVRFLPCCRILASLVFLSETALLLTFSVPARGSKMPLTLEP